MAEPTRCVMCGRAQDDVGMLIGAPTALKAADGSPVRIAICDECVAMLAKVVAKAKEQEAGDGVR